MGVARTGELFKSFWFGNYSSRDYGVYITGEAVFNAPQRDVEMITIPGRNGSFAKDNGRFLDVEVTYPAGIHADSEEDFAEAISQLRNDLCAQSGYFELSDDYNPDEYRLAVYKSGLDVTPIMARAGEFNITFLCKPQRFLNSGRDSIINIKTTQSQIINPTNFDAHPTLRFKGYGEISLGGQIITVLQGSELGTIKVGNATYPKLNATGVIASVDTAFLNTGDTIHFNNAKWNFGLSMGGQVITDVTVYYVGCEYVVTGSATYKSIEITMSDDFVFGTASEKEATINIQLTSASGGYKGGSIHCNLNYNGSNRIICSATYSTGFSPLNVMTSDIFADSTVSATDKTITLDLDIGNAYIESNNTRVMVNNVVSLPAKLPVLAPGAGIPIVRASTFSSVTLEPRWWRV